MTEMRNMVVRAGFWAALLRIGTRVLNLVQLVVLGRLLGPEDFGLVGIAMLVYAFVEAMTYLGFAHALIQRPTVERAHLDTLFVVNIARGVILAVLTALVAYPVALLLDEPRALPFIVVIGLLPLLVGLHNPSVVLFQKNLDLRAEFIYRTTGTLVALGVSIAVAVVYRSPWALAVGLITESIVQLIASYWINRNWPTFKFTRAAFDDMFDFGRWLLVSQALKYFALNAPPWTLAAMLGASTLGIYQVAARLSQTVGTEFTKLVAAVAFPAFSKLLAEPERMRSAYLTSQRLIASASALIFGLLIAMPDRLVGVLLGAQWTDAVPVVALMGVLGAFQAIGAQIEVLKAFGRTRAIAGMTLVRTIIVLALIYPLTARWGLEGAVLAAVIPIAIIFPAASRMVFVSLQLAPMRFVAAIAPALIAAVGMIGLMAVTDAHIPGGVPGLLVSGLWGSASYVLILLGVDWLLGGHVLADYQKIWQPLRARFRRAPV